MSTNVRPAEPVPTVIGAAQAASLLGIPRERLTKQLIPTGRIRPLGKLPGPRGPWIFLLDEVRRVQTELARDAGYGRRPGAR